jgi:hypothetical protein
MINILSGDVDFKNRSKLTLLDVERALELCLENNYFMWEQEIRQTQDSGPIGLSLMVVMQKPIYSIWSRRP